MYINKSDLTPPPAVLDRCHRVLIGDPAFVMWKMKRWCKEQNLSLLWTELVETSDVSAMFDEVAAFYFTEARDATLFSLKFK